MKKLHHHTCAALLGALLVSPAIAATSPGIVTLNATLSDYTGSTSAATLTRHDAVVWVTAEDGTFIKTLWKQGPTDFAHKDWTDHFAAYNTARSGSTALDGYTSATALDYSAPNSPISLTWNCKDASNTLVPDGNYKFWIQYSENQSKTEGPVTATGLAWTKGASPSTVNPPDQGTQGTPVNGSNFTSMQIVWTNGTVAPFFTGAAPPAGTQGAPYSFTCATSGSAPITLSVSSGALPTGLNLSATGEITGTPLVAGTFTGTITAENGVLPNASQPFSIAIAQGIAFTNVPGNGNLATSYNHACAVIGTAPVTFTLGSGTLPTGLSLSTDGVISGMPTEIGKFTGKIKAHNGLAPDATQDFSITISRASVGSVTLTATISDYTGATTTGQLTWHDTVVWVTDASGNFIKTLWKQGPADLSHKDWVQHFTAYNTARGTNTSFDGFTSATAVTYATPDSPIIVTWNCQDANGNLVDDGDYKFWIQYCERQNIDGLPAQGIATSGLTWTKGVNSSTVNPPAEGTFGTPVNGNNFTDMSIVWTSGIVPAPEIAVEQPVGTSLVDGTAVKDCGSLLVGTEGAINTFTIRNTGNVDLTGLAITTDGSNASDFEITQPELTTLTPTGSTTFTVVFKPTAVGARSAAIHIASNDADESPFDIHLTGTGTVPPAPEIVVMQPKGSSLVDGKAKRNFGTVRIGAKKGKTNTKTFTIKNTGNAKLTGLKIKKDGADPKAFIVGDLNKTTLAAGESTTLKVTFKPTGKGSRHAAIHIKSNDADESPFDIKLSGEAVK